MWWSYEKKPSVAEMAEKARKHLQKLQDQGQKLDPICLESKKIATTFWGQAWCAHLEKYCDADYRLPRGRSYVRNQCVIDLQVLPGRVMARVMGSSLYEIDLKIQPLPPEAWKALKRKCSGQISSMIDLLRGQLSDGVMRVMTDPNGGLFPGADEIKLNCSCPDYADMCKHVAASLYGVGARLDREPELLFRLRQVDPGELIEGVTQIAMTSTTAPTIETAALADVFGIEIEREPLAAVKAAPIPAAIKRVKKSIAKKPKPKKPAAKPKIVKKAAKKAAKKVAKKTAKKTSKRSRRS